MKRTTLIVICLLLAATILVAQSRNQTTGNTKVSTGSVSTCGPAPTLMPDGTTPGYEDYISASGVGYYWQVFETGHSYSVDAWDPFDAYHGGVLKLSLLTSGCATGPSYTHVANITPYVQGGNADRISWIAPSGVSQVVGLTNVDVTYGYSYYIRITDTTLYSPRWTTFGGYTSQFGFVNTTNSSISGTLTLIDQVLGGPYTMAITVPAGSRKVVTVPTDLVIPANHAGFASFAFVGPPGAIAADEMLSSPTGAVILPVAFGPRNFQH